MATLSKAKVGSIFKIACFVLICALALGCVNGILKLKDPAIETVSTFKQLPKDSVDVLFLGSSHAYKGINTGYLWDNWGMASYVLGGNSQPLSTTYYWLKDALRTQHPQLVVLDMYSAAGEERDREYIVWNTYGVLDLDSKLQAKSILSPQEDLMDHLLEYPNYHSRYSSLTSSDFPVDSRTESRSAWKGFSPTNLELAVEEHDDASDVDEREPLSEEQNRYLTKIIELCASEGIDLVFVNAPFQISESFQRKINTVFDIAKQHGIPFVDYNLLLDEIGLNFTGTDTDIADKYGHLNYRGVEKYNAHLGEWLESHFDIPDRRGETEYESWQIDADLLRAQIEDYEIVRISEFSSWVNKATNEDRFTLVLSYAGAPAEPDAVPMQDDAAIFMLDGNVESGATIIRQGGRTLVSSSEDDLLWHESLDSDELMVKRTGARTTIRLGYSEYVAIGDGITALLYDDLRGAFVEACSWEYDSLGQKETLQPLKELS